MLQTGGELGQTEASDRGKESFRRGVSSAGAQPERSGQRQATQNSQSYIPALTDEQTQMLQQHLHAAEALPGPTDGLSPQSEIRLLGQGQGDPADAQPQGYHV